MLKVLQKEKLYPVTRHRESLVSEVCHHPIGPRVRDLVRIHYTPRSTDEDSQDDRHMGHRMALGVSIASPQLSSMLETLRLIKQADFVNYLHLIS